jgi:cytochrome b pre-mRNA-processing protein 3
LGWLDALLGRRDEAALALYGAVVREGRQPVWYAQARVPDTIDGRFDCIATVLAAAILRLERDPAGAEPAARLTERFVDDMEGQIREAGLGDVVVGKHMGKLMAMLGGRLGAFRDGLAHGGDLDGALLRNLYRGEHPGEAALAHARLALFAWRDRLDATPLPALLAGAIA